MKTTIVVLVFCFVTVAFSKVEIKQCKRSDKDFEECAGKFVQQMLLLSEKGVPEWNLQKSDPFLIPSLFIEGGGSNVITVVQNYTNIQVKGISKTKIVKGVLKGVASDHFENIAQAELPTVIFEADYTINGRVLVLPIVGSGKATFTLQKVKVDLDILIDVIKKKGKERLKMKKVDAKLDPELVEIRMENLFNGDERLGKEMNKVLNENWKSVFDDLRQPYEQIVGQFIHNYFDQVFAHTTKEDFFST